MIDIIIPVFNGVQALAACLESVTRTVRQPHRLILIDDASTDPRVRSFLTAFSGANPEALITANRENLGFVGTVSRALAQSSNDAVVLNSDTVVTEGWLAGMLDCANSSERIGIVCPLSDNATLLTVPGARHYLARGLLRPDQAADIIRTNSNRLYPRLPTAVGFCMLLRRSMLERIGPLDPAFGRGYGEENDLSMRARAAGFDIACADDVFVAHAGSASFGTETSALKARNERLLNRRWPGYEPDVRAFLENGGLRPSLERACAALLRAASSCGRHVLYITHPYDGVGGIEEYVRNLVRTLPASWRATLLVPGLHPGGWANEESLLLNDRVRLIRYKTARLAGETTFFGGPATLGHEGLQNLLDDLFFAGEVDLVHVQSFVRWGIFDIAGLTKAHDIPLIASLHDMYTLCPDYNMRLNGQAPCGKRRAWHADAECVDCLHTRQIPGTGGPVSRDFVERFLLARERRVDEFLQSCTSILVPSAFLANKVENVLPQQSRSKVVVIPHGVPRFGKIERTAEAGLRIAHVGRLNEAKGARNFIAAAKACASTGIRFEIHGPVDPFLVPEMKANGIHICGEYRMAELPGRLRAVDLVLFIPEVEETFCLAAAEVQQLGVPPLAFGLGALAERIIDGTTGFLVKPGDLPTVIGLIKRFQVDRTPLEVVRAHLRNSDQRDIDAACADVFQHCERVLAAHGAPRLLQAPRRAPALASPVFGGKNYARQLRLIAEDRFTQGTTASAPFLLLIVVENADHPEWAAFTRESIASLQPDSCEVVMVPANPAGIELANARLMQSDCKWHMVIAAGDRIAPYAIEELFPELAKASNAVAMISNEDCATAAGQRYGPVFRPPWDPALPAPLAVGHFCVVRSAGALAEGGLAGFSVESTHALVVRMAGRDANGWVARARSIIGSRLDLRGTAFDSIDAIPKLPSQQESDAGIGLIVVRFGGPEAIRRTMHQLAAFAPDSFMEVVLPISQDELELFRAETKFKSAPKWLAIPWDPTMPVGKWINAALRRMASPRVVIQRDAVCVLNTGLAVLTAPLMEKRVLAVTSAGIGPAHTLVETWLALGHGSTGVAAYPGRGVPLEKLRNAQPALFGIDRRVAGFTFDCFAIDRVRTQAVGGFGESPLLASELGIDISARAIANGFDVRNASTTAWQSLGDFRPESPSRWAPSEQARDLMLQRHRRILIEDPAYPPELCRSPGLPAVEMDFCPPINWHEGSKPRVISFPFDSWGSGHYRVRAPLRMLTTENRIKSTLMPNHDTGRIPNLPQIWALDPDVILAHNFLHDAQLAAAKDWQKHTRCKTLFGLDDLLTAIPEWNPFSRTVHRDIDRRLRDAFALFDTLVVSTPNLAEHFAPWHQKIVVIENGLDDALWDIELRTTPREGRVRAGWAGANQHFGDLAWLESVVAETSAHVDWVFLGAVPDALARHACERHPMVPIDKYPSFLAGLQLDIAIAPLADHPFNRAKSNIKVLEYGRLGIPVLASAIEPYANTPAITLPNKTTSWRDALMALAADACARERRGKELQNWVLANGMLASRRLQWLEVLMR
jgi:GT2 family glycosyltransferase/glycosyltransferase involved in cell wall biosynthesis